MKKTAIGIGVHERIDDMDAHLDIMSFAPELTRITVCSNPQTPKSYLDRWALRSTLVEIAPSGFYIGPLMALAAALEAADSAGCDYLVYRNADDWMFNHQLVFDRVKAMRDMGFLFAGYNWLTYQGHHEFAINEITVHVPSFMSCRERMVHYFNKSSAHLLCEFKMARWAALAVPRDKILRLADREQEYGVGNELELLNHIAATLGKKIPDDVRNNHRFFNRQWQMLGHHDQEGRLKAYDLIKDEIPYRHELEMMPEFRRWLLAARRNLPWNAGVPNRIGGKKIPFDSVSKIRGVVPFRSKFIKPEIYSESVT